MLRRDHEVRYERGALPGLILDGLMPIEEVARSILGGEFNVHWLLGNLFKTARISPSAKGRMEATMTESAFDEPQAMAACHCLEALLGYDHIRQQVVEFILQGLSRRQGPWLRELLQRLSWDAKLDLLTSLPSGNNPPFASRLLSSALLDLMGDLQEEPLVLYADGHQCLVQLYRLTRHPSLLVHATASERDQIFAVDIGL